MSKDKHTTNHTDFQALIPFTQTTLDSEVQETVNARDVHAALEVGKDFTSWIKAQLKRAHLTENKHFITFTQKGERKDGARGATISTEYHLTIDAAKHVAMLSGTTKGGEIRDYFIEAEKRLRHGSLDEFPELASINKALYAVADVKRRQLALEAAQREQDKAIIRATVLAQEALSTQMKMTLRDYRHIHKLDHQLSDKMLNEFARYLTGYCLEQGIPISETRVADRRWGTEHVYHVSAIENTLPGWLTRYNGQKGLDAFVEQMAAAEEAR